MRKLLQSPLRKTLAPSARIAAKLTISQLRNKERIWHKIQQVGIDGETRWKPEYKVVILVDTVLIYNHVTPGASKLA